MFITIISVILGIAAIVFIFLKTIVKIDTSNETIELRKSAPYSSLAILVLFIGWFTFNVLDSQHFGLKQTFGKINDTTLEAGLYITVPFAQKIVEIPKVAQTVDINIPVGPTGAITKDNQTVGSTLRVIYRYNKNEVAVMYKNFGVEKIDTIIRSSAEQNFKTIIGKYGIFEIAEKQEELRGPVAEAIRADVLRDTASTITIESVSILNYDWSDAFDRQIEETAQRSSQVKQKEQEKLIAEQEAQKLVKKAEADKTTAILAAEATKASAELNAQAKALEGEGIKKFNESISADFDQTVKLKELEIELAKWNRWDGGLVANNMYGPIPVDTQGGIQGVTK